MFCRHCGSSIAEDSQFCHKCGKSQDAASASSSSSGAAVQRQPAPEKGFGFAAWVGKALLLTIGVALVFVVVDKLASTHGSGPGQSSGFTAALPTIQHSSNAIVSDTVTIEPGHYLAWRFVVPQGAENVRLSGHFEATGGSGNDVEVYVVDEDGMTNVKNGHSVPTWYNSGKVTAGTINAALPSAAPAPRVFYLVASNTFSLLSNKALHANITLEYDRRL